MSTLVWERTDDDPSMRHMLLNYLEQHEMRVTLASRTQDVARQFAAGEEAVSRVLCRVESISY